MKQMSIAFSFTMLLVIAGSASALSEQSPQGSNSESKVYENSQRHLHLESPPISNAETPSNTSTKVSHETETQLNFDNFVDNEEEFNRANALASQILSNSKSWQEEANSMARILQTNVQEASDLIQDRHSTEQKQVSQITSRTETAYLLDSINDLISNGNLDLRPENNHNPNSSPIDGAAQNIAIFVSFSMPQQTLRSLIRDAGIANVPVYLRGFKDGSLTETARYAASFLSDGQTSKIDQEGFHGLLIDPRIYRIFQIEKVPTFVAFQGSLPECDTLNCRAPMPDHDRVAGNISLRSALELLSESGTHTSEQAENALIRLEGDL